MWAELSASKASFRHSSSPASNHSSALIFIYLFFLNQFDAESQTAAPHLLQCLETGLGSVMSLRRRSQHETEQSHVHIPLLLIGLNEASEMSNDWIRHHMVQEVTKIRFSIIFLHAWVGGMYLWLHPHLVHPHSSLRYEGHSAALLGAAFSQVSVGDCVPPPSHSWSRGRSTIRRI